jgi:hypothetical protein
VDVGNVDVHGSPSSTGSPYVPRGRIQRGQRSSRLEISLAVVYIGGFQCLSGRGIVDRAGQKDSAAARRRPGRLPGPGRHDAGDPRLRQAGRWCGYNKIKGLNGLLATIATPLAAPVIGGARVRVGAVKSALGAGKLVAEALGSARACGAGGSDRSGLVLLRGDSAFYCHDVITTARRGGARFSITARMDAAGKRAIAAIGEDAWTPIRC